MNLIKLEVGRRSRSVQRHLRDLPTTEATRAFMDSNPRPQPRCRSVSTNPRNLRPSEHVCRSFSWVFLCLGGNSCLLKIRQRSNNDTMKEDLITLPERADQTLEMLLDSRNFEDSSCRYTTTALDELRGHMVFCPHFQQRIPRFVGFRVEIQYAAGDQSSFCTGRRCRWKQTCALQ